MRSICCILLWVGSWSGHFQQGELLERRGNLSEAAAEFEAALSQAGSDTELPLTLHNLGAVYRKMGRNHDAERCYQRAIDLWTKQRPNELAGTLENLAALHLSDGRLSKAESLYREAWDLAHSGTSLLGLARVMMERRRFADADLLFQQAAEIVESKYGADSLAAADVAHQRGMLYRDWRKNVEARPLLERARALYERFAPNHPNLAIALRNLADLETAEGNRETAGPLYLRAVEICDRSLPPGHPQTAVILQAYGLYLRSVKRNHEARVILDRAQTILAANARQGFGQTVDVTAFHH